MARKHHHQLNQHKREERKLHMATPPVTPAVVATPTFSPLPGSYTTTQSVTLSTATPGATIYYTIDGSQPTTSSPVYSSPLSVAATTTINAIATLAGDTNSTVATGTFTITPESVGQAAAAVAAAVQSDIAASEAAISGSIEPLAAQARAEYDALAPAAQSRIHALLNDLENLYSSALPALHTFLGAK
jgi:hypothetical protein